MNVWWIPVFTGTFALLLLAVGALLLVLQHRRRGAARRRRADVMASYGWAPGPPDPRLVALAGRLTSRGRASQMFTGDFHGRRLWVLDYEFTTRRGPSPVHLIALALPVALPELTVSKDSVLPGVSDIELESQAFNERFRVQADDQRFASAVLQPRMMEWLLQNPGLQWHLAGDALVSWGYGEVAPTDVLARLEAMAGVIDRIPPFVLTDYGVS